MCKFQKQNNNKITRTYNIKNIFVFYFLNEDIYLVELNT